MINILDYKERPEYRPTPRFTGFNSHERNKELFWDLVLPFMKNRNENSKNNGTKNVGRK